MPTSIFNRLLVRRRADTAFAACSFSSCRSELISSEITAFNFCDLEIRLAVRDPVERAKRYLLDGELATADELKAIDADVIGMATHNRGALARFFVGSVANFCLRNATMPVVLLRPGEYALDRKRSHHRVLIDRHD